jgi:hypothetical protein
MAPLVDVPGCDECGGRDCEIPYAIASDGMATRRPDGPHVVVSWPACPRRYEALRPLGLEVVSLAEHCRWAVLRGIHRDTVLGAGAARLLREYTRLEPIVPRLCEAKAVAEARRG